MGVTNFLGGGSGGGVNLSTTESLIDRLGIAIGEYPLLNFNITTNLSDCSISNDASIIQENSNYQATLSADSGFTIEGATVVITMGGEDITSTVYSNGTINIENVTGDIVITAVAVSSGSSIYGVSWVNDTTTTMTRTDDAVGMTYAINSSTGSISSDMNSAFPWNEATVITDGYGNKFLHMPDMYFRIGKDANGDINSVAVSKTQGGDGDWFLCESFDYGCYGGSLSDSLLQSKSGQTRLGSATRAQLRTYAGNNSETGYTYHQLDLKHKIVMMFLWWIEWATKDSASIMTGRIEGSGLATGGTDSLSTPSGFETTYGQMRYHYIEDFVGNRVEFIDGICAGSTSIADYVTDNPAYFSDTSSNMSQLSWIDPASNCIMAWGMDNDKPFLVMPSKTTGATDYTQAFCDRIYNPSSQYPVVSSGASYNTSYAGYGLSYFYRGTVSYSYDYCGGRLLRQ